MKLTHSTAWWCAFWLQISAVAACAAVATIDEPSPRTDGAGGGVTTSAGGSDGSSGGRAGSAMAGAGGKAGAANVGGSANAGGASASSSTTSIGGAAGVGGRGGNGGVGGAGGRSGSGGTAGAGVGGATGVDAGTVSPDGGPSVGAVGNRCGRSRKLLWRGTFAAGWTPSAWSPGVKFETGKAGLTEIVDDTSGQFGKVLRVHYDAGVSDDGGAEFKARIPGLPADAVCFSYWVRFDSTFQWVKGGKLPGLCAGECFSGGNPSDGINGWSMRNMWRANGAGEGYAYITPPGVGDFGTQLGLGTWKFATAKWHRLDEELVLNTPGQANGVFRVWFDRDSGVATPNYQVSTLTYRTVSNAATRISLLFFSTFFGGSGTEWAPTVSTSADFAMFELFE